MNKEAHKREIPSLEFITGRIFFTRVTSAALKPEKLEAKPEFGVRHSWQGSGGRGLAAEVNPVVPDSLAMDGNKPSCANTATTQLRKGNSHWGQRTQEEAGGMHNRRHEREHVEGDIIWHRAGDTLLEGGTSCHLPGV